MSHEDIKSCKRVHISTGEANTAKPIPDKMAVKREWLTTVMTVCAGDLGILSRCLLVNDC